METVFEGPQLTVTLNDKFLSTIESDDLYNGCIGLKWPISYEKRRVNITFGDDGLEYVVNIKGNTIRRKAVGWNNLKGLLEIKDKLEKYAQSTFNFCAIMRYDNGSIIIKKHKDKEMCDGSIYGISVGSVRRLKLSRTGCQSATLHLQHGSLYTLHSPTNSYWVHEILPEENVGSRFSLTFRRIKTDDTMPVDIVPIQSAVCTALIKSGPRKGSRCGSKIHDGAKTCKKHARI